MKSSILQPNDCSYRHTLAKWQESLPENQLFGPNGNLHARAHVHLDLQGAASPNLLPSPQLRNFPRTISPRPTARGPAPVTVPQVPALGLLNTSPQIPAAPKATTAMKSLPWWGTHGGSPSPTVSSTMQMDRSHSLGLSCQHFFVLSPQKDWEAFLKVYLHPGERF